VLGGGSIDYGGTELPVAFLDEPFDEVANVEALRQAETIGRPVWLGRLDRDRRTSALLSDRPPQTRTQTAGRGRYGAM